MSNLNNIEKILATSILALLGFTGSILNIPLFFGVDFLLGSIFVFVAVLRISTLAGVVVAIVTGSYTLFLWGHPYALINLLIEALVVGYFITRNQSANLPNQVILFWLVFGLAFISLCYHFLLGLSWTAAALIAFKQAVNDIFNALLATFFIKSIPLQWFSRFKKNNKLSLKRQLSNLLAAFAFFPALVVIVINASSTGDNNKEEVRLRVEKDAAYISTQMNHWQNDIVEVLRGLTSTIASSRSDEWIKHDLDLILTSHPDFLFVHWIDTNGKIKISTHADKEKIKRIDYTDRPWFQEISRTHKPVYSNALIGRTSGVPAIAVAVPVLVNDVFVGLVLTSLKSENMIDRITGGYRTPDTKVTLIDGIGKVIVSTDSSLKSLQQFSATRGGVVKEFDGSIYRWQPHEKMAIMPAWSSSYYARDIVLNYGQWSLVTEQPLRTHISNIQQVYLISFIAIFSLALFTFLLGSKVSLLITGPLQQLGLVTNNLGKDISKHSVTDIPQSELEEIDELADNFKTMASTLKEQYGELALSRENLEKRVAERTRELEQEIIIKNEYSQQLETLANELQQQKEALDYHAIVSISDEDGLITYVNDKLIDISGFQRDELLGNSHRIFKSGVHDPSFYQRMWETITEGKVWHGEICNRKKNGEQYWVSSTIVPFLDDQGKPYQFVSLRTDITELVKTREEIRHAKEEADDANKAKSQFLSSMSHELRTPLNAILGFSQLLQLEALNTTQSDNVEEIYKAGKHLHILINDILDLSKIESGNVELKIEPVDVSVVIDECQKLLKPLIDKNKVKLEIHLPDIQPWIMADYLRFKQVMINLVSNAIKYNNLNGIAKIFVSNTGKFTRITIQDSGPGIPAEKQQYLFTSFNRLGMENSSIEGTGIGLVITQQIVNLMGGKIGFESVPDSGSTFWVEFPGA